MLNSELHLNSQIEGLCSSFFRRFAERKIRDVWAAPIGSLPPQDSRGKKYRRFVRIANSVFFCVSYGAMRHGRQKKPGDELPALRAV